MKILSRKALFTFVILLAAALSLATAGCSTSVDDVPHDPIVDVTLNIGIVDNPQLNVRALPDKNSDLMATLAGGDTVIVAKAAENGWVKVMTADGVKGYVSEKYLKQETFSFMCRASDVPNVGIEGLTVINPEVDEATRHARMAQNAADNDAFFVKLVTVTAEICGKIPWYVYIILYILEAVLIFGLNIYYMTDTDDGDLEERFKLTWHSNAYDRCRQYKPLTFGYTVYGIGFVLSLIVALSGIFTCEFQDYYSYGPLWMFFAVTPVTFWASYNMQRQPDVNSFGPSAADWHEDFNRYSANALALLCVVAFWMMWGNIPFVVRLPHIDFVHDSFWGMLGSLIVINMVYYVILGLWNKWGIRLLHPLNNTPLMLFNILMVIQMGIIEYHFLYDHFFGFTYFIALLLFGAVVLGMLCGEFAELAANRCSHCHCTDVDEVGRTDLGRSVEQRRTTRDISSSSVSPNHSGAEVSNAYESGIETTVYNNWLTHHQCNACNHYWEISHTEEIASSFSPTSRHWTERY